MFWFRNVKQFTGEVSVFSQRIVVEANGVKEANEKLREVFQKCFTSTSGSAYYFSTILQGPYSTRQEAEDATNI